MVWHGDVAMPDFHVETCKYIDSRYKVALTSWPRRSYWNGILEWNFGVKFEGFRALVAFEKFLPISAFEKLLNWKNKNK